MQTIYLDEAAAHIRESKHTTWTNPLDKPTRTGNSETRDTFPDHTFMSYLDQITWTNVDENLDIDRNIIGLSLKIKMTTWHGN